MQQSKHKVDKDALPIRLRLEAGILRQRNKSEDELRIAELLENAAQRIEALEIRLRGRPAS